VRIPRPIVFGDLLYDLLARVEGSAAFGTDTFAPIHAAAGGSGANTAAWLASLGVETRFVGDDLLGETLARGVAKGRRDATSDPRSVA
jgi:sugar/nucleoside kinase (ribokinase family)